MYMQIDKRTEERVSIAINLNLEGGGLNGCETGCTRDISESGIYFVTNMELTLGSLIEFTLEYDTPTGLMALKGNGRILRIDYFVDRVGGAARIIDAQFEAGTENDGLINK